MGVWVQACPLRAFLSTRDTQVAPGPPWLSSKLLVDRCGPEVPGALCWRWGRKGQEPSCFPDSRA